MFEHLDAEVVVCEATPADVELAERLDREGPEWLRAHEALPRLYSTVRGTIAPVDESEEEDPVAE
jgi:hypothetical protein